MNLAARRPAAVIAIAVITILLSSCAAAAPDSAGAPSKASTNPSTTPTPKSSPTPTADPALDLSFGSTEDGVGPGWQIGWTDPFVTDQNFSVLAPDDGAGSWSYTDVTTACEIHFYQGQIFDLDYTQDDRATSDHMLAVLGMGTPTPEDIASISASATDFRLATQPDDGLVEMRIVGGSYPDGRTVVQATRMFATRGGGLTVSLSCPAGVDASSEFSRLSDSHLGVVVVVQ